MAIVGGIQHSSITPADQDSTLTTVNDMIPTPDKRRTCAAPRRPVQGVD